MKNFIKNLKNILLFRISISISFLIVAIFYSALSFYQGVYLNDFSPIRDTHLAIGAFLFVFFIASLPISTDKKNKSIYHIVCILSSALIVLVDIAHFILKITYQNQIIFELFIAFLNLPMVCYFLYTILSFTKILYSFCKNIFKKITQTDKPSGIKATIESLTSVLIALTAFIAGIGGMIFTFKELIKSILL